VIRRKMGTNILAGLFVIGQGEGRKVDLDWI